jgi:hypothetical protein
MALIGITDGNRALSSISDAKWLIPPLGVLSLGPDEFIPGNFSVISNVAAAPISVSFASQSAADPNLTGERDAALAAHLARYSGTLSASRKDSLSTFFRELWRADMIQRARELGGLYFPQAPNLQDSLIDWSGSGRVATAFGGPAHTPWSKWTFDGIDDYIESGRTIAQTDHTIFGINDGTLKTTSQFLVGSLRARISPSVGNRTRFSTSSFSTSPATSETYYKADQSQNTLGGIHFVTRANAGQYTSSFGKNVNNLITATADLTGTATFKIGAGAGNSNQAVGFYPGDVMGAGLLKAATPGQRGVFVDAYAAFVASLAAGS